MRIEWIAHSKDDIEAEEEIERQREEFEELEDIEVRLTQHINYFVVFLGSEIIPRLGCIVEYYVELEVLDDLLRAQERYHSLPSDDTFAQAHVED